MIEHILKKCREIPSNTYLLQTKNPGRLYFFHDRFPPTVILGTTIETNREGSYQTNAPPIEARVNYMEIYATQFRTMVSIEPVLDFDLFDFVEFIQRISPDYVSIGADSKNKGLPEPSAEKIERLIIELEKFTEVRIKSNLARLRS